MAVNRNPKQGAVLVPPLTSVLKQRARTDLPERSSRDASPSNQIPRVIVPPLITVERPTLATPDEEDDESRRRRNPARSVRSPAGERPTPVIVVPPRYQQVNRPGWKGWVLVQDPPLQ